MVDASMHRIERYFMRPLSVGALVLGLWYLLLGAWVVGSVELCIWLAIGFIGQRLHPTESVRDLIAAGPPEALADMSMSAERAERLELPVAHTATMAMVGIIAALRHGGSTYYWWIPAALASYVVLTFVGGGIARGTRSRGNWPAPP